ncbi:aconitase X [Chloroflexota bacterium]
MKLSGEEARMLDGEQGPGVQKAMELLVAVGKAYGAERMVKVVSSHLVPPDLQFWTTGQLGEWARELVMESLEGAEVFKVDTTINPVIFNPDLLKKFGYPQSYVDEMKASIAHGMSLYERLGVIPAYTCCPFFSHVFRKGEHLGMAETTAVLFSNSILGAMTNRESGPTALATALTGRTPLHGMHLPKNRLGQVLVELKDNLNLEDFTYADYSALSYYVGGQAMDRIPVYAGLPSNMSITELLYLSSAHSGRGGIPMFHAAGITPEAPTVEAAFGGKRPVDKIEVGREEIKAVFETLCSSTEEKVNFVLFGCPHATLEQIRKVARLLNGKKTHNDVTLILATSDPIYALAQRMGLVEAIQDAGGFVVSGLCSIGFPRRAVPQGFKVGVIAIAATGSAHLLKAAGLQVWFGSIEQCVKAAIKGKWEVD